MRSATLTHLRLVLPLMALASVASVFPTRPTDEGHKVIPKTRALTGDAPRPRILLDASGADDLFSGRAAKLVILHAGPPHAGTRGHQGGLWLVDFSREPVEPVLVRDDAHTWIGDPFISPDGTRVVYHDGTDIIICRLDAGGTEATKIGPGYDPRWWIHPTTGDEYVIYVSTKWNNSANVEGETYCQRIETGGTAPVDERTVLVRKYALRGGRSRNGRYMSPAQPGWVLAQLFPFDTEDALLKVVASRTGGHCNVSMGQDSAHPRRFLWLDGPHRKLFYDPATDASIPPLAPYREYRYTEWSTHGNFMTASFYGAGTREFEPQKHIVGVYDWSREQWTPVARGAATHHLWVEETTGEAAAVARDLQVATAAWRSRGVQTPAPEWPTNRKGLMFLWENAHTPAQVFDRTGHAYRDTAFELTPHGRVRYTRDGAMKLEGGFFVAEGIGEELGAAIERTGELTVEMRIKPESPPSDVRGVFFVCGPSDEGRTPLTRNVAFSQLRGRIDGSIDFGGGGHWGLAEGGYARPVQTTHIVLSARSGSWSMYAGDGGASSGFISHSPRIRVEPNRLVFGSVDWLGTIEAVAIYARRLEVGEDRANELAYDRQISAREHVTASNVAARLVATPVLPDPSQSAYKRAWAAFEYETEQVHSGAVPMGRIVVARYVWLDGEQLPAAHAEPGAHHELLLEPYEANTQIHAERQFHLD
ncbi:MAG: hypothetical protein ABGY41_16485, partial [Candidatus Poribacteria bacterium]